MKGQALVPWASGWSPVGGSHPAPFGYRHSLGPVDTGATQAAPGLEVAVAAAAVHAHERAVLAVRAIAALVLAPPNAGRREG